MFVFGCVWLCEHVLVCDGMCCLRCVVGCRRCVDCCVVTTVQKKAKTTSVITEKIPRENFFHCNFILIRKIKKKKKKKHIKLQSSQFKNKFEKINLHPRQICNYFRQDGNIACVGHPELEHTAVLKSSNTGSLMNLGICRNEAPRLNFSEVPSYCFEKSVFGNDFWVIPNCMIPGSLFHNFASNAWPQSARRRCHILRIFKEC